METFGSIFTLLKAKPGHIYTIAPTATVYEAIKEMSDKNIGALLVMDGDALEGVISERDYTRKVMLKGKSSKDTLVREIMLSPVITVTPHDCIDDCMRLMTEHRIRHIPVMENDRVTGVISIGDLVNWIISSQTATISSLEDFISGKYPG